MIGKFLSGECSQKEQTILMEWVKQDPTNQAFFDEMQNIWEASANVQEEEFNPWSSEADFENAWQKIDEQTPIAKTAKVVRFNPWRQRLSIAAAILLLIAAGWWWKGHQRLEILIPCHYC